MKKIIKSFIITVLTLVLTGYINFSYSQQVAKKLAPIDREEVAKCKKAVEASPDSLSYHKKYLEAIGWVRELMWGADKYPGRYDSTINEMEQQYKVWMNKFPKCAAVPLAIGQAFCDAESPKATDYLKKAVQVDPNLAEGYFDLSMDAERWGNQKEAMDYMKKASDADPKTPSYLFYYTMYFDDIDMKVFRDMIYDLVKKFPNDERGAQGLYWLGVDTKDLRSKIKVYEDLRALYPPQKFRWSESAMDALLYSYLLNQQYKEAASLAESMIPKQGWPGYLRFTKGYAFVQQKVSAGEYQIANDTLKAIKKLARYFPGNSLALLEAEIANKMGNPKSAFESLVTIQAKSPTDELQSSIKKYAAVLGKNDNDISAAIWEQRNLNTKPATPFELGFYTSDKKAKLTDFQGKVILMTFWFPGCGPCRGEFPYFEHVAKKFLDRDFVYLGINVSPDQDDYVLPFMKGTKYSFIPLRGTSDWAEKAYKVRGEPTNFLIDKKGNIVYANFRTDAANERTLELMIQSLLEKN